MRAISPCSAVLPLRGNWNHLLRRTAGALDPAALGVRDSASRQKRPEQAWRTHYRGRVPIQASLKVDRDEARKLNLEPDELPTGT
jgi:hypothetical protein